jgi:hypothetical protein
MSAPGTSVLKTAFARSERMVSRRIAGEFVLVPIMSRGADVDSLFTLNRVGAFIWEHLDGQKTGAEIVAALQQRFEVDGKRAQADYCRFLEALQSIKAVTEPAAMK